MRWGAARIGPRSSPWTPRTCACPAASASFGFTTRAARCERCRPSPAAQCLGRALFLDRAGGGLLAAAASEVVADITAVPRFEDPVIAHVLRRTFGTTLIRVGTGLVTVALVDVAHRTCRAGLACAGPTPSRPARLGLIRIREGTRSPGGVVNFPLQPPHNASYSAECASRR